MQGHQSRNLSKFFQPPRLSSLNWVRLLREHGRMNNIFSVVPPWRLRFFSDVRPTPLLWIYYFPPDFFFAFFLLPGVYISHVRFYALRFDILQSELGPLVNCLCFLYFFLPGEKGVWLPLVYFSLALRFVFHDYLYPFSIRSRLISAGKFGFSR